MATIEQLALSREGRREIVNYCIQCRWPISFTETEEICINGEIGKSVLELPRDIRQLFFIDYETIRTRIDEYVTGEEVGLVSQLEPGFSQLNREIVCKEAVLIARYRPQPNQSSERSRRKVIFALALRDLLRNYH